MLVITTCLDAAGKLLQVGRWNTFVSVLPIKISVLAELLDDLAGVKIEAEWMKGSDKDAM